MIAATALTTLGMLEASDDLRTKLKGNSEYFRSRMSAAGFTLAGALGLEDAPFEIGGWFH